MMIFAAPWFELTLALPLVGAACVRLFRDALPASRCCLGFTGATLACSAMTCAKYFAGRSDAARFRAFEIDELNAPLLPLVALLHLLTALTTARTKMGRFSFAGLLAACSVRLAIFASVHSWLLVGLLSLDAVLPAFELRRRGRAGRLYVIHASLFIGLLVAGCGCVNQIGWIGLGSVLLLAAVLVRTGVFPAHVWLTDLFESGSFGTALLFSTPLVGVYAAVRLVMPYAPEWSLEALGVLALFTSVYAAGMGLVQIHTRRFFAYLFVSHASLVLVGLGLHTPFAVTGALVMWLSTSLALTGLGLTLRAIEARVGSLNMNEYRGLYEQSPELAVSFLLTGLAAVGFPGTAGFIAVELLVDEAVGSHLVVGFVVVMAAAINGIGVVRAYLLLFTGRRHVTGVNLGITPRARVALITLVTLILGGGVFPQTYLESRHRAAEAVLRERHHPPDDTGTHP